MFLNPCFCSGATRFLDPDSVGSGFEISANPDPIFKFLWIRIRFLNFSGSGFSPRSKKECRKGSKSFLLKENLKIMTKDCQKCKRQQFLIKSHHRIDEKISRKKCLDPDPVLMKS